MNNDCFSLQMSYEAEEERIQRMIQEVYDDQEEVGDDYTAFPSDSDEDFTDHESGSDHNTESEEDCDLLEADGSNNGNQGQPPPYNFYLGKDKTTKWKKDPQVPSNVRTRQHNIITHLPGVKSVAKRAITPVDAFHLFITKDMIHDIVEHTNDRIEKRSTRYTDKSRVGKTNYAEITALLGLLYLAGSLRSNRQNNRDLWADNLLAPDVFKMTMSLFRFQFLLQNLRFDQVTTRNERQSLDKLAPIRTIFETFVENCKANYTVSEYVTIDEMLVAFRGRCGFRQFMPKKPAQYGIKIYNLAGARMFYTLNLEIYAGKQPEGQFKVSNSPQDVVERLIIPLSGSGRNITVDYWLTSIPLASRIMNHNLTITGTIRKNKREIPPQFVNTKRCTHSSLFGFQEDKTLVSYIPKKGKVVLLLSTMHHDAAIDTSTGESQKPEINTLYNLTKGGVDVVDFLSSKYDVSRNSRRWPLTVVFTLINICGINSQIIYESNSKDNMVRRKFLQNLGLELVKPFMEERANVKHLPRGLKEKLRNVYGEPSKKSQPQPKRAKQGRCSICPRSRDRKSKIECKNCKGIICMEHLIPFCRNCASESESD